MAQWYVWFKRVMRVLAAVDLVITIVLMFM